MNQTLQKLSDIGFDITGYIEVGYRITNGVVTLSWTNDTLFVVHFRCPVCLSYKLSFVDDNLEELNKAIAEMLSKHLCDDDAIVKHVLNRLRDAVFDDDF